MDIGSAFNPGFLGGNFFWWVGQIADKSYWDKNMPSGKFADPTSIPGWGGRRKVRIIGLHPQSEEELSSDKLPWAQIMYPVTAGGGQSSSKQTANLRQGMFVFGFFLDGTEQQVPVIMGVLGNNSQTKLIRTLGEKGEHNFKPISGSAQSPSDEGEPEKVPDRSIAVSQGTNVTIESNDGTEHQQSVADALHQEEMNKKVCVIKKQNGNLVQSALTSIQTVLDKITEKIDKRLAQAYSYIDAASERIADLRKYIANLACEITKYMKIIFDQMMEFELKKLNASLINAIASLPCSVRSLATELKEKITSLLECLYNNMVNCAMVQKMLDKMFNLDEMEKNNKDVGDRQKPKAPMCVAEGLTTALIIENKDSINKANKNILDSIDGFLGDVEGKLADVRNTLGVVDSAVDTMSTDIMSQITSMVGNISSALNFSNISFNIFGCEFKPIPRTSDIYQFAMGGMGAGEGSFPDIAKITDQIVSDIDEFDMGIDDAIKPYTDAADNFLEAADINNLDKAITDELTRVAEDRYAEPSADEPDIKYTGG